MKKSQRESPKRALCRERRLRSWELRKAGMTLRAIGAAIGVSHVRVKVYLDRTYKELEKQELHVAKDAKKLELARLDQALLVLQPSLQSKVPTVLHSAIDKMIALGRRRAALLGLDAPQKIAPTNPEGDKQYDPLDELSDEELNRRAHRVIEFEQLRRSVARGEGGAEANDQGKGVDAVEGTPGAGVPDGGS